MASVFIFWNVSISALSFSEDCCPCLSMRQLVLRYSNLLNDLPSINGRYLEKVSVEGAVNQRKVSPGLSRARFLK